MEILLSVLLGELTTRSISFFISKYSKPSALEVEDRLRKLLLRAQVIIEEAMGRQVTNQALIMQLNMLSDDMHRGYYMLDTFRYQPPNEEVSKDSFKVLDNLSSMITDVEDMVMFLMSYPRLYSQPYSMHLQLGNCMFGRQMERELVINFLLHTQTHDSEELEVLPIVGPGIVGKSTLIAHVCKDERVRDHFSEILFLHGHDFADGDLATLREEYAMKHQDHVSNLNKDGRLLVVVELDGDLNNDTWNRLYFACKFCMPSSSKIIVTSRSDKIIKFGTTQALSLKNLSHEAYWYFFKTLTFGSMDPEMHPNYVRLAMEIARMLSGCLIGANITAYLLRDNFDIHFWCDVFVFLRGITQKHISKFGGHPFDLLSENRPAHLGRMAAPSEDLMLYCQYQRSSQEDVPNIRIQDVMYGSVKPHGKFEVLAWRSEIPPYYSYINTCEIRELKGTAAKRKRSMKNGVTLC